ncbi:MAG: hypothetical protein IIZ39_12370, partial [Blautia sp.]|nr:hypothetical protein [Blautia sp.]
MEKQGKEWQFCIFAGLCILLNYGGKMAADSLGFVLWLDSIGTALLTYVAGPVCGILISLGSNLAFVLEKDAPVWNAFTGVGFALVLGLYRKRLRLEKLGSSVSVALIGAFVSMVYRAVAGAVFPPVQVGNLWGDAIWGYGVEMGFWSAFFYPLGIFYVDLADKLVSMLIPWALLRLGFAGSVRQELYGIIALRRAKQEEMAVQKLEKKERDALAGLALVFLLSSLFTGNAQAAAVGEGVELNDYVQMIYSSKNGLPCGEANDIAMTNDGVLWVGTYAGLYRYNGKEFRWMNFESVRNVNCLYVDLEGRLWIGSNDNGVSISINESIVNVLDASHGLPSNSVRAIIESSDGYFYVGTSESMQILTLNSGLRRVETLWEVNYTDQLAADESGHVAAVTEDGRLFLLQGGKILCSLRLTEGEEFFSTVAFDEEGRLYAGTSHHRILLYDISEGLFVQEGELSCPPFRTIQDLFFMEDDTLLVVADNGIGYFSPSGEFRKVNTNSFNNSIENVLLDYQDNFWFTSSRLGLLRMAQSSFRDIYSTIGMDSQVVNAVTFWQGNFYFGTDKGLDVADGSLREQLSTELSRDLEGMRIRCLFVDSHGSMW